MALLALTTGCAVANLYYIQPLLNQVARALRVTDGTAGLLVTCTQLGYVAGLVLLVPLGDLVERRRLIATLVGAAAVAAGVCAVAPGFAMLAAALIALGLLSAVAQIVVPLASALAAPSERGKVVGTVMSGLLVGILTARTLSGLLAQIGGWRLSFTLAAVVMLALALRLSRALPPAPPAERVRYRAALRSVLSLIGEEPLLRQRMVLGAVGFAGFSALWTTVAFLLGGAPYHYGEGLIGLFGLAGAAGALVAPVAGGLGDRGHGRLGMTVFLLCVLGSWLLLALGRSSLIALVAGIVLLDLGIQGAHVSNQTAIYSLRSTARGRLTTAYMVAMFLGGVGGSLLSTTVYSAAGWLATCVLGAGFATVVLAVWISSSGTGYGRIDRLDRYSEAG